MPISRLSSEDQIVRAHLRRILVRATEIIADEVLNCASLEQTYGGIGDLHPASCREGHIQSLLFTGLRGSGYVTFAQALYFVPSSNSRRIDLAVWILDVMRWLYLEIEPLGTQGGLGAVPEEAQKLINDAPRDSRDQLRAVLVYGFRQRVSTHDRFREKYNELGAELERRQFTPIGIELRQLGGDRYEYVQVGLWALSLPHD